MNHPNNPPDDEVTDVDVGECDGKCCATTSIAGTTECGRGECDRNGFWSIPCYKCTARVANAWALKQERIVADLRARAEGAERERDALANKSSYLEKMKDHVVQQRDAALARLAALRIDLDEQCRLLGAGGSREAKLKAEVEGLRRELERERAKREVRHGW